MLRNLLGRLFGKKNSEVEALNSTVNMLVEQNRLIMEQIQKGNAKEEVATDKYDAQGNMKRDEDIVNANDSKRDALWNSNSNAVSYDDMDWKELQRVNPDAIRALVMSFNNELYVKGYKEIEVICDEYRVEVLQQYVMNQYISQGQYDPEKDNLESLSKKQLVKIIKEMSENRYIAYCERNGKSYAPSKGQIEVMTKNNVDVSKIRTSLEASVVIDKLSADWTTNTEISEAQTNRISTLVNTLGLQAKDYHPGTRKEASKMIQELQAMADEVLGDRPATEKQIEYYKRALKLNNKRFVGKAKALVEGINQRDISVIIKDLMDKYNTEHPELSEGQEKYLTVLLNQLMLPFNADELKKMTKVQATAKIDELTRELLYVKTRLTSPSLTKEDIAKMKKETVKEMLEHLNIEKKTDYYDFSKEEAI
jgi:hypothetical protein